MVTDEQQSLAVDHLGPVDHLVVEFPSGLVDGEGVAVLLDLVDQGVIYVLDLEFVEHAVDGSVRRVDVAAVPTAENVDPSVLNGAMSGLLDDDDLSSVGSAISPGTVAAVLLYENLFVEQLTRAFHRSGGRVVSQNRVSVDDLTAAFDRVEANES